MTAVDCSAAPTRHRIPSVARAGLFGLVVAVTWWVWASAASADERPDAADSSPEAGTAAVPVTPAAAEPSSTPPPAPAPAAPSSSPAPAPAPAAPPSISELAGTRVTAGVDDVASDVGSGVAATAETDLRDGAVAAPAATVAAPAAPLVPAAGVPQSLLASVGKVVDGVVTPVVTPVVDGVVAPGLQPVLAPVYGLVAPVVEPIVRPLGATVHGMVGPMLAPVVDPVVAAVARVHGPAVDGLVGALAPSVLDAEGTARALAAPSVPAGVEAPAVVAGAALVDPALAPAAPPVSGGAARRVASTRAAGTSGATSSADAVAATGQAAAPAAPATPALPVPRHSSRLPWSTGPAAPASAGGRDLPDRAHNAVAHATVHAHTATPARHAPVTPRVVGASVNSGSRPSVTPD